MTVCVSIIDRARWYHNVYVSARFMGIMSLIDCGNNLQTYIFLLLSRLTNRLLENIDGFFPSLNSCCDTSIFFLSWLFFSVLIFFSMASRFSRTVLCSRIFSRVSATISSASIGKRSVVKVRGSVEVFWGLWSNDGCCFNLNRNYFRLKLNYLKKKLSYRLHRGVGAKSTVI